MGIHTIVFDFDGTLVESNRLKYDAYFSLFPADTLHAGVIRSVLARSFEQPRHMVIEKILQTLGDCEDPPAAVETLARKYNRIVTAGAGTCPEKPGAQATLERLVRGYALYVSSTTPQTALREIIRFRKWDGYFRRVFGFPNVKGEMLRRIMALENASCGEILVVGDGESDRHSALENGCPFMRVTPEFDFEDVVRAVDGPHRCPGKPDAGPLQEIAGEE